MVRNSLSAIILTIFLSACVQDAYTGEQQASRAAVGAGVGAGIGAALGAVIGGDNRRRNALIGAGAGALAGGAVGAYMDQQERELRRRLENDGVRVVREGDVIVLNMRDNVEFPSDSAALDPRYHSILESVALVLDEYEKTYVDVIGHTDNTGSDSYNKDLSRRRAESVANFLIDEGLDPARLATKGAGEDFPIASNASPEGRQANRRVEIALTPVT